MTEQYDRVGFEKRKQELLSLDQGWYDGRDGEMISKNAVRMLDLVTYVMQDNKLPFLYPTLEGGFSLEWDDPDLNLEIHANGSIEGGIE